MTPALFMDNVNKPFIFPHWQIRRQRTSQILLLRCFCCCRVATLLSDSFQAFMAQACNASVHRVAGQWVLVHPCVRHDYPGLLSPSNHSYETFSSELIRSFLSIFIWLELVVIFKQKLVPVLFTHSETFNV